jgi:F0F1-type ATP synthase assembly protein I
VIFAYGDISFAILALRYFANGDSDFVSLCLRVKKIIISDAVGEISIPNYVFMWFGFFFVIDQLAERQTMCPCFLMTEFLNVFNVICFL